MAIGTDELIQAAVANDLIDALTAASLRLESRRSRADLLELVLTRGRFPAAALYRAVAETRGMPFLNLNTLSPSPELLQRVPEALLRRRLVLPVSQEQDHVLVATIDPDDQQTLETLSRILGRPVRTALTDPESLKLAMDRSLGALSPAEGPVAAVSGGAAIDPVSLLDRILRDAFLRRASDIHLEPQPDGMRCRLRVDGRLEEYLRGLSVEEGSSLISRVKVLAGLDIAEQRAPQDGGLAYRPPVMAGQEIDIRVATMPTHWGERATLRLLGTETRDLTLSALGMAERDLVIFREAIRRPHGMILLTGPTGSGKTTTLYAALREINRPDVNIMTVEDPVEYVIPGIAQVQVGGSDKVTFASALRSLLRHDPDVLMIGEIRDREAADVAMKAAMTGHLVFSTLHTNSALGAITRLLDIGCEPYLIGSTLVAVIAQRLVRRLCRRCRRPVTLREHEAALLGVDEEMKVFESGASGGGSGCSHCLGSGFRGRIGLFECLWVDGELSRQITRGAAVEQLQKSMRLDRRGRLTTLRDDGLEKVRQGMTTLEEVLGVTVAEE